MYVRNGKGSFGEKVGEMGDVGDERKEEECNICDRG
jgi:hypothetical protein